jgi:hypothetical protein
MPKITLLLSALLLLVATETASAVGAHAAPALLTCTGLATSTFNPGLRDFTQTTHVTATENYSACISSQGPLLTSGHGSLKTTEPASCTASLIVVVDKITYTFGTGPAAKTSHVVFTKTVVTRQVNGSSVVDATGTVTSGYDAGAVAERVKLLPSLSLTGCSQPPGVTSVQGPATLTFIRTS